MKFRPYARKRRGFLWRLYSYWRLEERDGGIYVELESVGLSRSVPVFFAWLVNPLLKSLPKSYLSRVLNSTSTALTKRQLTHLFCEETVDCFGTHLPRTISPKPPGWGKR